MKQIVRNVKIIGTSSYLPENVYTNQYLETLVDTIAECIEKNLGIKEKRIASKNQCTCDLASQAALRAIENSGLTKDDIDYLIPHQPSIAILRKPAEILSLP